LPQPDACNQAGLSFFSGDFADVNPPQDYLSNTEGIFNTPLLPTNEPFEELGASFPPLFLLPEVPTQRSTVPETEDDEGHARCARCEKRFPSVRQRNKHAKRHERHHQCPHTTCEKKFRDRRDVGRHYRNVHEMLVEEYSCLVDGCTKTFKGRKDNMYKHVRLKHPEQTHLIKRHPAA
jgi:hypothetical protein